MTWQGSGGAGGSGEPPEDDTRVDWSMPGPNATTPPQPTTPVNPPGPPAPPPTPEAPAAPLAAPGGYMYPAELAEQQPTAAPPAFDAGGYAPGGYPPAGTWQPPQPAVTVPGALKFGGVLPRLLAYWVDGILLTIVVSVLAGILGALAGGSVDAVVISAVFTVGVSALYFIGFWTGGGRATPGMRLFHLQIGQAADGRTLSVGQAVIRWAALGYPVALLTGLAPAALPASGLLFIWEIVLLATTASSPTRQGLHDRLAGSAMVAPEGNEGPVIPCLVLAAILLVVLPFVAIIGLIALGGAVTEILREVGTSI